MARLTWGDAGARYFETGVDRGVLYVSDNPGVPWNGLISVDEKPAGGSVTPYYIDGDRYYSDPSSEEFAATINAYTYPDEFGVCDGSVQMTESLGLFIQHQPRQPFAMTYRTLIGNDTEGTNLGYKIHLLYNLLAAPSEKQNDTISDSPSPNSFSWDVTATPPSFPGVKNSAHLIIDSRTAHPNALSDVEGYLYGSSSAHPQMPDLATLVSLFEADATLRIADNGDGSWTATTTTDGIIGLEYSQWVTTTIDNFSGSSLDSGKWVVSYGDGDLIVQQGGLLNLSVPSNDFVQLNGLIEKDVAAGFFGFGFSSSGTPDANTGFYFGIIDGSGNALEFDIPVIPDGWSSSVAGDMAVTETTGDGTALSAIFTTGGYFAIGSMDVTDGILWAAVSPDGENWTQVASMTFTGTFDNTTAAVYVGTYETVASTSAWQAFVDAVKYYVPQPDPPTSDPDAFSITWDSAVAIDENSYSLGSL